MSKEKIIRISDFQKMQQNKHKYMPYEDTDFIRSRFVLASCIVDTLFVEAENLIREVNFNPADFTLIQKTGKDCLSTNLKEFFEGGEESMSLAFETTIAGVRYVALETATISNDDTVEIEGYFLKWDETEWLLYDNEEWIVGLGPDFI